MRILIWQTAYLGDVVLTTPLILTVQRVFPESKIGFVGRSFIRELLKGYPIELITFDKSIRESFSIVKRIEGYDAVVSPHISARSALMLFLSKIPIRIGFDRSELPWLYTHRVKHVWSKHEVDRNLDLLTPLGVRDRIKQTKLFVEEEEKQAVKRLFSLPEDYVVLSPFSNFPLKEWSLRRWKELTELLTLPAVVVGTANQQEKAKALERKGVINLVGRTSLRELMAIISLSKAVVSCDSAAVHIANALGVPAISVYTSTSPSYGFYPLLGGYLAPQLSCSPCSPNPKECKRGDYVCLSAVKAEDVFGKLLELLP
ncbi:MAG: glycosyltransferase family 9 protein [Acidobacteria bacterium]|jgi:heptosyltransferase-2|nr:MAG: glycosyltransferase family 9 protein [Acidobacteriota bacterium]